MSAGPLSSLLTTANHLAVAFAAAEDRLVADLGLSSARTRVMDVLAESGGPRTVPHIARRLGLSRQAVQRLADDLTARGLTSWRSNPDHARAQLVVMTERGQAAHGEATRRKLALADELARGLEPAWLQMATELLTAVERRLAAKPR